MTNAYAEFGALGAAALDMIAARRQVLVSNADRAQILGAMRTLPAHPEVAESLARLQEAGLRLAALTNSTLAVATDQLTHAGLAGSFEQILSADMVRRPRQRRSPT